MNPHPPSVCLVAWVVFGAAVYPAAAQNALATARDSYASADYDRCLSALDSADMSPGEVVKAGEYRALCLVALNRDAAATKAVEAIVLTEPLYQPAAGASPRLKSLVVNVKRSVLPSIIQDIYATAKKDFDARNYPQAAAGFRTVVAVTDDAIFADEANTALTGLRVVSRGFLDLISAMPTPAISAAPAPSSVRRIATGEEPGLTLPATITQELPIWRPDARWRALTKGARGKLEIIIDEAGGVEAARLLKPLSPDYDDLLVRAARNWKYSPARLNGAPVKYKKLIDVVLQ